MFVVLETKNTIDALHGSIQQVIIDNGFSLLHYYDFHALLEEKGFPIQQRAYTYEICRASMASKMLTHVPVFSSMMPCRISIYEQEGLTYIATLDMLPMLDMIKDNHSLHEEAVKLYQQLLQMMNALSE